MAFKTVFVFCLNLIFIKNIVAQCIGSSAFLPTAAIPVASVVTAGVPLASLAPAGISVATIQAATLPAASCQATTIPATGIHTPFTSQLTMHMPMLPSPSFSILSDDLAVEGIVSVSGSLPFLGTVTLGGNLPLVGEGIVNYYCGNGEVGIVRETPAFASPFVIY